MHDSPILYVIASPIGNLSDISARALEILSNVNVIAAEDTRRARTLLSSHGISKNVFSLRAHNETKAASALIKQMTQGNSVAFISDAGTPGICDPGAKLVKSVRNAGFLVSPVPGASALSTLLSVSGCESHVHFFGFPPRAKIARTRFFKELPKFAGSIVLFEAPTRIIDALQQLNSVFDSQTKIVLGREMTKLHEQILVMPLNNMMQAVLQGHVPERGEFVLLVESPGKKPLEAVGEELFEILANELPPRKAAQIAARFSGLSASEYYKKRLEKKNT